MNIKRKEVKFWMFFDTWRMIIIIVNVLIQEMFL